MKNFKYDLMIKEHELWLSSEKSMGVQAVFEGQDLSFLTVVDKRLDESIFIGCNLQRAIFDQVSLKNSYFKDNMFSFGRFTDCSLSQSNFKGNDFSGVTFENTLFGGSRVLDNVFSGSVFKRVSFDNIWFDGNQFDNSDFVDTVFQKCRKTKHSVSNCCFTNVSIKSSFIKEKSKFKDTSFINCILTNSYCRVSENNLVVVSSSPVDFLRNTDSCSDDLIAIKNLSEDFALLEESFINQRLAFESAEKLHINYLSFYSRMKNIDYYLANIDSDHPAVANEYSILSKKLKRFKDLVEDMHKNLSLV